jgi:hypothetical protein
VSIVLRAEIGHYLTMVAGYALIAGSPLVVAFCIWAYRRTR